MKWGITKRPVAMSVLWVPALLLLVFLLLIILSAKGIFGQGVVGGSIVLSDVSLQAVNEGLYLDAQADINLPDTIKAGLDSGVPLAFILSLKFIQPRAFWFDQSLARYQQRYVLTYYELTRHYRVHAQDTDVSRNYRSLSAALSGLGNVDKLPIPAPEGTSMTASLTFKLDTTSLPLPLQPLIISSWRLSSEEYLWPVN